MAETGSRRGAATHTSLVLSVVAFVAIGGLIYWLNVTAEPTQVEVVPEETQEEPASDVPIVGLESLRAEIAEYVDLEIEMRNQVVNSLLGDQAFWIGPQDNPFLVKMDSVAGAEVSGVETSDTLNVRGEIRAMSDSVLNAWEQQGVISGSGERAVASFAEYFLEANRVGAPGSGGGDGEAGEAGAAGDGGDGAGR